MCLCVLTPARLFLESNETSQRDGRGLCPVFSIKMVVQCVVDSGNGECIHDFSCL